VEQVKRFSILPEDWLPGGDELTPTMKLKRKPIEAKYGDVLYEASTGRNAAAVTTETSCRHPADGRGVEAELVTVTADQAGPEPGSNEHRPKIPRIVVGLVIVHLLCGTDAEAKRGELQKRLAKPRRDVEDRNSTGSEKAVEVIQRRLRLGKVLEDR
jgi:hypothetical protein